MKNFIKIFFIIVCFFITLGANATGAMSVGFEKLAPQTISNEITIPDQELGIKPVNNEVEFVCANTHNAEISAVRDRKDNFAGGFLDRASAQNRLLQQIFSSNYNKTYYSTSHKISPLLKNEICTRAP